MLSRFGNWNFLGEDSDTEDVKLHKSLLVFSAFTTSFAGILWSLIYFNFNEWIPGLLPLAYGIACYVILTIYILKPHKMTAIFISIGMFIFGRWGFDYSWSPEFEDDCIVDNAIDITSFLCLLTSPFVFLISLGNFISGFSEFLGQIVIFSIIPLLLWCLYRLENHTYK